MAEPSSDDVTKALLSLDSTKDLINDIERNGGLIDPIIVLNQQVIEGNTRLCAYRRLYERTKDSRWERIKSFVIKENLSEKDIFSILSNYHIRGKKQWDLYEKAACINKMIEQGLGIEEVAKEVGSTKVKVENMLKAYKVMRDKYLKSAKTESNEFFRVQEELKKFSYFEAFYNNKNLVEIAEKTPDFLEEFVQWVAEGRIPKATDVRQLHNILENKKAQREFRNNDPEIAFEEAKITLHWNRPDKIDGFYKKVGQFRELIREQNVNERREEILNNKNMKDLLRRCLKDLQRFCEEIGL